MNNSTLKAARSITWKASRQAYLTARLFVDRKKVNDFYLAYAYFRWLDDVVDDPKVDEEKRLTFIQQQVDMVADLFLDQAPEHPSQYEEMIVEFVRRGKGTSKRLKPFVDDMLATIEFDARRRGRLISEQDLDDYCVRLAASVVDGLQYFIGSKYDYPEDDDRLTAATAAQIAHLLQDTYQDLEDGIVNIPREYLEAESLKPEDIEHPQYRKWVKERIEKARNNFDKGKAYFDTLAVLRLRMAGLWYCTRFASILNAIEREGYLLRPEYTEQRSISVWLKLLWTAFTATVHHIIRRIFAV
ncbi:squalene/phytoene synthase family protein [bacterium]|nr:squalene/phytoene synthase family protein [bacterium]MBU1638029.1 squalene/phytoene synthase family protein [bacterium]